MDWNAVLTTALAAVVTAAVPILLPFAISFINARVRDQRLAQWGAGAAAAAGRVLIRAAEARLADPGADLRAALGREAAAEARRFFDAYRDTARALGATREDALARITGEVARLPAAQALLAPPPAPPPGDAAAEAIRELRDLVRRPEPTPHGFEWPAQPADGLAGRGA